jgi:hypothetical protein
MLAVIALMLRDLQQMLAIGYHIVHMTRASILSSLAVVGIFFGATTSSQGLVRTRFEKETQDATSRTLPCERQPTNWRGGFQEVYLFC